jgi:Peptidase family M23
MSRSALISTPALTTFLVVLRCVGPPAAVADERWRRPLPGGAIVAPFTYERAAPYMHGRRRGIDISARPGSPVLSVCDGTVTYAGHVPRWKHGVTIRCRDGLIATELGLSQALLARGARVRRGTPLGLLDSHGTLRLGARLPSNTNAYINPEPLLTDQPPQLAPPPPLKRPRRIPSRRVNPPAAPHASPPLPWPTLLGATTLASAALGGTTLRIHRRRRRRAPTLAHQTTR